MQTVLVRVAGNWRRVARDSNPEAYVRRALLNEHISWWRRHRRALAQPVPPKVIHDPGEESVNRIVLWQALTRLTPRQRAVLILRFSTRIAASGETGELMGCSPGTVKSRDQPRARRRLRGARAELAGLLDDTEAKEARR